ncbi:hypothetical protein D3C86_2070370 [compost metagenome]
MDDRLQMQFLRRQNRKAVRQIKTHLVSEDGARAGAGAVTTIASGFHHMPEKVEILFHGCLADS